MSFPPLRQPSVFVAAPGDMEYLREAAIREFTALADEAADSHGLQVYDYRYEIGEDGFKDWIAAQGQIPLPSDPLCRAVVCLLGEKIGTPLSHEFDVSPLGPLEQYADRTTGVRLVHPWEPGAEEEGGFALTGTIFEYLVARRSMQQQDRPPVLLLLVGDETIRDETDEMAANWGHGRYRNFVEQINRDRHGVAHKRKTREWEDRHYYPQIRQLINFRRYVESGSFVPNYVSTEQQARVRIRTFLRDALDLAVRDGARAPFKGLETYGQQDLSVFFGREAERKEAVGELSRLWNNRERPNFFGVIGGSGVGKSSFARTALIGHLCHHTSEGSYVGCVMRTADLLAVPAVSEPVTASPAPLRRVLELALPQLDPDADVPAAVTGMARIVAAEQPAWVLEQLVTALRRRGPQWRLLLAFDQFEELLDQRAQAESQSLWAPVVQFIEMAASHDMVGVIYTLQTNREELISQDPVLGPLWARGGHVPLAFPMYSLEQIVREPFRVAQGIEVESGLVAELRRRIRAFAERCDPQSQGSLLPLVSLTLTRIFNACGSQVIERAAAAASVEAASGQAGGEGDGARARHRPVLLQSDCTGLLDVETAIAQLADEALEEARSGAGADWSDDAVGSLLRRLVRTAGAGRDRYELPAAALPARAAVRRLADAMTARRLLIPEPGGRVKLVHEAVLRHWPRATRWLEGERRLLRLMETLTFRVEEWQAASRSVELLAAAGTRDVQEIGEVLVGRSEDLTDEDGLEGDLEMTRLRDYGLALLAQHPQPLCLVESGTKGMRHVHIAALYGSLSLLRCYLELDPGCVHAQRADGRTPLFFPALMGRLDVLDCLLAAGARADAADNEGWQPVHGAASGGHRQVFERLCEAGADPHGAGGPWQLGALHLAAMSGHIGLLDALLARADCDPGQRGSSGWTAMHLAAESNQCETLRRLHANDPGLLEARLEDGRTALHLAVAARRAAAVTTLLLAGADIEAVTADGKTPLALAIAHCHEPTLRAVLASGPDLTCRDLRGRTSLQALVILGLLEPAALLLEAGAAINAPLEGDTLLHAIVRGGDEQRLRFLLQHDVEVDARGQDGRTALHHASAGGHLASARLLAEAGADLAAVDARGRTALHEAVLSPRLPVLEWLLARPGLDADARDADGMNALHLAVQGGHDEAVGKLLQAGAQVDPVDNDGWTPLLLAAQGGLAGVVSALVDAGAQVRVSAARPAINALQAAAEGGHAAVLEVLLAHGAQPDIDLSTAGKAAPLELAVRNGWFTAALKLLDCGASLPADVAALVAMIDARGQQLAPWDDCLPDEAEALLVRLGQAAPDSRRG